MLRESATLTGTSVNLEGISDPSCTRIDDVPHSAALLRFCDTFLGDDAGAFAAARESLAAEMGVAAMVDVAGIASNFQRMDRIADGIGIPSDDPMALMQQEFVDQLGLQEFPSARNTPKMSWLKRQLVKLVGVRAVRRKIESKNIGA
jgi:hypothetical protein